MIMKCRRFALFACLFGMSSAVVAAEAHDVVVYGSSPAAIAAAVQAARMGKTCVIVSPETRIGGLTTGGLGQTDIGNKSAFGGIALEFYRAVADHYRTDANWKWQKRTDYLPDGQCAGTKGADSMWTFEPSAALKILEGWVKRDGLAVHRGKRLLRNSSRRAPVSGAQAAVRETRTERSGVKVEGEGKRRRIVSFVTEDGTEYVGKMFVDATYEGDLMAAAGVSYHVGREANAVYGETLNGVQTRQAKYHQFPKGVDPYVVPGDPKSGLLPGVESGPVEKDGTGDRRVQAYCFRMCLTDVPENRIPFAKPAGYDERDYELLFRMLAAKPAGTFEGEIAWELPWINSKMPNRKTDTNNRDGFSTDFIGRNWNWPEASYAEREAILAAHLKYQRGLMWTLANHPRVPEPVRREVSRWGTCRDEFADGLGDGWQRQLYVREARRMVGDYVVTELDCTKKRVSPRPVAMAAYTMDSHNVRRHVGADGFVRNEGDVEVGFGGRPFPIDYGAIVPKRGECANLFVPVCLSASHIAFGSIRMEPVFFALGQAAATAAAQAIDAACAVQDLPYGPLAARLARDGQVLRTPGSDPSGSPAPFEDGDTVVFFGDSITHGGRYHEFLTDFYRTRYPERKVRLVNAGIGGDTCAGGLSRVDVDVAAFDPTWVFVHFGMNDVARGDYGPTMRRGDIIDADYSQEAYRGNLAKLVKSVRAAVPTAKLGYLTPTVYDDTASATNVPPTCQDWRAVNNRGCSIGLAIMAGHVLRTARREKCFAVNWFSPMQKFLWSKRVKNDWHYMITKFDRVHPNAMGAAIMALEFLKAQNASPVVSDVTLDAAGTVLAVTNAAVSGVAKGADGLAFDLLENALPFPLDPEVSELIATRKPAELLNTERLAVKGLADGRYALAIDGRKVCEATAKEFAAGLELGFNPATPQYAQAQEVFRRTKELTKREAVLRNHHSARWAFRNKAPIDDIPAMKAWYEKLPSKKGYFEGFVPGYLEYWPHYRETREELWADQEKVRALAKPSAHRYEIRKI